MLPTHRAPTHPGEMNIPFQRLNAIIKGRRADDEPPSFGHPSVRIGLPSSPDRSLRCEFILTPIASVNSASIVDASLAKRCSAHQFLRCRLPEHRANSETPTSA